MTFGSGEVAHHLICEFYAGGNIVLTDANYKILALLRTYKAEDGSMNVSIGETYPTVAQQTLKLPTSETLDEAIKSANMNTAIRDVMAKHFVIGTEMIDHCLASCGIDGRAKAPTYLPEWTTRLIASFKDTLEFAESPNSHPGFVVFQTAADRAALEKTKPAKKKKGDKTEAPAAAPSAPASSGPAVAHKIEDAEVVSLASVADRTDIFYDNFVPTQFTQYANLRFIQFPDFDSAVDEYFSKVEGQKVEAQRIEHEQSFTKRVDKVREDNQKRVQTLVDAEDKARKMAVLLEQNAELVDTVIKVVNGYLARQIDWTELAELVKQEKKKGNPIASVIHKLKLDQNSIVVLLYTPDDKFDDDDYLEEDEEDEEEEDDADDGYEKLEKADQDRREAKDATAIEIDLSLSAYKNSEKFYTAKKKATDKKDKTIEAANTAVKRAEKKARSELKEVKLKASIQKLRSPYWFEKFNWFISSEGFIVISGRDMQQNEQLYKRYLAKGDAYIHADIHGASTCIVKNPTGQPIPPRTLTEAGALSVCHSAAWKNRIVTSAWWVEENQVSKTAPTGEYLSTGSFMIRGKKNFLPPANLVMGFGILFRLADESIAAHMKETTDDDIRREKDRKNQERDLIDQMKHAEDFIADDAGQSQSDQFVDIGEGESDGEEDEEVKPTGDEENATEEKPSEAEEDEEEEESDDDEHEAGPTDSKFQLDLAQQDDLDEDESALLAEAEEGVSGLSVSDSQSKDDSSSSAGDQGKKRLTKNERARLKKAEARGVEVDQLERGPKPTKKPVTKQEAQQQQQAAKKKKKIPKKYQHQDEEERRAAMELLGSAGKPKGLAQAKATSSSSATTAGGSKKGAKVSQQQEVEEFKEKVEARKKAQAAQLAKDREEEEIRQLMKDEKLEQLNETDLEKLREGSAKGLGVNLSALTGRPQPTDVLLYAMTICAPYDALGDFKYKIKITPGTFKKGKSSKLAINAFLHQPEATERERELIRSIPENELSMTMISNAKLQMPGLLAGINNKKK